MKVEQNIFEKIISGEVKSAKIWENEKYIAILDAFPNTKGMTLVIPKKRADSDIFSLNNHDYKDILLAAKEVAHILEKGLNVKRIAMVAEGMGINHLHIKLYPLHGLPDKFTEMWAKDKVYFDEYEGYLSTQIGPQKDIEELNALAKEIMKKEGIEK